MKNRITLFAILAVGLLFLAQSAKAQDYSNIRIVRLSFVEGTVQYHLPGQDWQDARLNLPIQEGFAIRTADGYAEVEFEDSLTLRMATNATVEFTELALQNGGRITKLEVPQGTAIISAKLKRQDEVSVAAPDLNLSLPPKGNGRFRLDISPTETWVTVFRGKVDVESRNGTASFVSSGHTLHRGANESGTLELASNPPQDDFDKWVSHREDAVNSAQSETSAFLGINSYTEGFADLYDFGVWSDIPGYGSGWMPYGVGQGWMPFVDGQWQFMGGLGWNWVSGEPWGWLPYHFGSWVNAPGIGWAWLPVGTTSWVPATARWVNVNNQLAWIPYGPPLTSKATKTQLAAIPTTAILAAQGAGGAISAGARLPVVREGTMLQATLASAPSPNFGGFAKQSAQSSTFASGAANSKAFVQSQSAPNSLSQGAGVPPSQRGPNISASAIHAPRLSSVPKAMMAPHSLPAPVIARGASTVGFRGGFGANGGSNVGTLSTNQATSITTSPSASATTSVSHSGGSMGSAGGHR